MSKNLTTIFIETSQGSLSLKEISEKTGVSLPVIRSRYYRGVRGDDLLKPKSVCNKPIKILFDGELRTLLEISLLTGLSTETVYQRYKKRGITGEKLFTPSKEKHNKDYYIGKKFNRLTVLSISYNSITKRYTCICKCECGTTREYDFARLRSGQTTSCGCYLNEVRGKASITHHMSTTKEHKAWRHIKERCFNTKSKCYSNYGGRGITMCERWRESFEQFYADMGPAPSSKHSVERINVDGNYEPSNCKWATDLEQSRNKRTTRYITYKGQTKSTIEWEDYLGLGRGRLRCAYNKGRNMEAYITILLEGTKSHVFVKH